MVRDSSKQEVQNDTPVGVQLDGGDNNIAWVNTNWGGCTV